MNVLMEGQPELSMEELQQVVAEEISRRKGPSPRDVAVSGAAGTAAAGLLRDSVHQQALKGLTGEFDRIRQNPERHAKQMDQMVRTVQNFENETGNPIEYFLDGPGQDYWAAGRLPSGEDVVFFDSTAPHPAVMAHELGHVNMNHSNDPLAFLQTSGIGRASGQNAVAIGGAGAALGALAGQLNARRRGLRGMDALTHQGLGTAAGIGAGALGSSGMAAYEAEASRRALGYLPEDVSPIDAAGDLGVAHSTYLMAGPGRAAVTGLGIGSAALAAAHPDVRRKAGELLSAYLLK